MNEELKAIYEILLDENSNCTSCELRLRMLEELEKMGIEE